MQLIHLNTKKKKKKKTDWKMNRRPKQTYSKEDIQIARKHEKILNIVNHQMSANHNHEETLSHTFAMPIYK